MFGSGQIPVPLVPFDPMLVSFPTEPVPWCCRRCTQADFDVTGATLVVGVLRICGSQLKPSPLQPT